MQDHLSEVLLSDRWHRGETTLRGLLWRLALVLAAFCAVASPLRAAPYPAEGRVVEWTQPNGTAVTLRVFGDEFYASTTTKDGYTVVFEEADQTYYLATLGKDGVSLVSSGIMAGQRPPLDVPKQLQEPRAVVSAIRAANVAKFAPDRAANWKARVQAVQAQRARAAAPASSPALDAAIETLAAPVTGLKVGLMIIVQFPDDPATVAVDRVDFPTTRDKIVRYANEAGYADDGNSGSIRDYFYDQSNGQLMHTQLVTTLVTLPHPRNYYNYSNYPTNTSLSDNGAAGRAMVTDAINKLKSDGFDFSSVSVNASNRVIATNLLFAGRDSGVWSEGLWPHAWYLASEINVGTVANPRYIYGYQITDVESSAPVLGTVCHELGHLLLAFPDLYDTDASDGDSEGVGEHCLMGSGGHLNGGKTPAPIDLYLKDVSGWASVTDITTTESIHVSLPSTGNQGYRVRKPGTVTEYFLIENRGTEDKWASFSPDWGILIWHIDEAVATDNRRQQMTASEHYEVSVEQADGRFDLENNRNRGDFEDLFDSATNTFNNDTTPNADWWSGAKSDLSLTVLSAPGASMNVRFGCDDGDECNGVETRDTTTGMCRPGTPPFPDDGFMCSACLFLRGLDNVACGSTVPSGVRNRFAKAASLDARQALLPLNSAKAKRLDQRRLALLKKALKRARNARRNSAITQECFEELSCRIARTRSVSCLDPCPILGGQVTRVSRGY